MLWYQGVNMKTLIGLLLSVSFFSPVLQAEEAIVTPYIVGGIDADVANYPFMASLMFEYESQPNTIYPFCGGSVLDATHILTAAHCVYDISDFNIANTKVAIDANNAQEMFAVQRVAVKNIYYPSNYNDSTLINDVAVLELSEPLPTFSSSHVVNLGDSSNQGYRAANKAFTILGYGRLDTNSQNNNVEFMKAEVTYVSPGDCNIWANFTTSNKQICTEGKPISGSNLVTATCQGDSGGPLVWNNNGIKTQVGIVSFGPAVCGDETLASQSVFTDVSQYKDWIIKAQNGEIPPTISVSSNSNSSGGSVPIIGILSLSLFGLYRQRKQ